MRLTMPSSSSFGPWWSRAYILCRLPCSCSARSLRDSTSTHSRLEARTAPKAILVPKACDRHMTVNEEVLPSEAEQPTGSSTLQMTKTPETRQRLQVHNMQEIARPLATSKSRPISISLGKTSDWDPVLSTVAVDDHVRCTYRLYMVRLMGH